MISVDCYLLLSGILSEHSFLVMNQRFQVQDPSFFSYGSFIIDTVNTSLGRVDGSFVFVRARACVPLCQLFVQCSAQDRPARLTPCYALPRALYAAYPTTC